MHRRAKLALGIGVAALAGCGGGSGGTPKHRLPSARGKFALSSPDFTPGGKFPSRLACGNTAPALRWSGAPANTRELAIVVRDVDAPGGEYRHWSAWRIPAAASGTVPMSSLVEGRNDFGHDGYGAPCPPKGDDPHTYVFTIYALARAVDAKQGAAPDAVNQAIAAADPLASGELRTTYGRH
jgi:Raf kinase inhibitor-like YbhB/YbcL family protein